MSEFRTTFPIPEIKTKIDYHSTILSLGSCFSENIGQKLTNAKFSTLINPFGIIYNPESIANSLEFIIKKKRFTETDLFEHKGIWNSFYHHSRFSHVDKIICLQQINTALEKAFSVIQKADFILITFGTSWVYELKRNGNIVSNCHKVPAKEFSRYQLATCDIVERFNGILKEIKTTNKNCKIVLTVSPVRHLKDGATENQLSKATLLMAVNELVECNDQVYYFPSYELMMDDLRDYRFYAEDMVHPSQLAVDYIWEKFKSSCIEKTTYQTMKDVEKITSAMNHRPFQPEAEAYQNLLKNNLNAIKKLVEKYPAMDFIEELLLIQDKMK